VAGSRFDVGNVAGLVAGFVTDGYEDVSDPFEVVVAVSSPSATLPSGIIALLPLKAFPVCVLALLSLLFGDDFLSGELSVKEESWRSISEATWIS